MEERIATRKEQIDAALEANDKIRAQALANSRRLDVDGVDLRDLAFSQVPFYGHDHCGHVAAFAYEIGRALDLPARELEAVKLAGLLHDAGRERPWMYPDPGHQQRAVEIADRILRANPNKHGDSWLRERVAVLILGMDLSARELPTDPAARVLWDVDALDAARFAPNTPEGLQIFTARARNERLCLPLLKEREAKRQILAHRNWSGV